MASKFEVVVFDLGGVLLEWDRHSINALSPAQFLTIMNSTTWHELDRGNVSLKEACKEFGNILDEDPALVESAMDQAQLSLKPVVTLVQTIQDIKESRPDLKFYVMSNISKEHFKMVQSIDLPWSMFDKAFASGIEGMRKPDLCFFQHVIKETGVHPRKIIMVDDTAENICAARSQGMHAILVNKSLPSVGGILRSLLQDPLERAERFLKDNARNHHCVIEGHNDIILKDNFAQFMIWELTDDEDIIYLKWPYGKTHGIDPTENGHLNGHSNGLSNGHPNGHSNSLLNGHSNGLSNGYLNGHSNDLSNGQLNDHSNGMSNGHSNGLSNGHSNNVSNSHLNDNAFDPTDVKNGLWNYFFEAPVLTSRTFPPDADTTSTAYLSLPARYLSTVPDVQLVLEKMATNLDLDGIMQTYFDPTRPRTTPEVCCNILRLFHKFGFASDPRIQKTEDYIVACLTHNACLDGNRHYSTPESFLYFVARLYAETPSISLRKRLHPVRTQLQERLNVPVNPLSLALRLFAAQEVGLDPLLYRKDLDRLVALQDEDGGWPAGHFCCIGRTGARIGNRGLTAALAVRILRREREDARLSI
ncbi:MAG: hypothetical protein Q9195_008031 [Heterodermia aff. obscurata]